ncbi:ParB family chromosome partitioning protein [Ruminiclostridium sufflavum DSM 19573]|uniref:ParB family chromosome partitioning protein n=1 Tax=Ruminiclostridium sufflavum DSM 19573 TaxID=1121337 RepID=A0A318XK24_9FIRM|nr:ParB N-terminal domain-containing protein [Ruminiclostridium sufflavum]PYG84886.1 ParB family chromosome partitioning protein [Ruminiclostridium sufflavum DSM 19573]
MKIDFSKNNTTANNSFAEMFGIKADAQNKASSELDIDLIVPFENHPFRLYDGEKLKRMVESIQENGVMTPIVVRKKEDGTYETLAGHNRINAARLAGLIKIPAEIKENISDAQAKIIVTDSNFLQRSTEEMLPSELAKSLKMQLEACKEAKQKQEYINAIESDSNADGSKSCSEGAKVLHLGKSRDSVAKKNKMSHESVRQYIRLNHLTEELLNMVDEGSIKLVPAVSLSYLTNQEQAVLFDILSRNDYRIDMKRADTLKERSGKLTEDDILAIASGEFFEKRKKAKLTAVTVKPKLISRFFNAYTTQNEITATIEAALEEYFERRKRQAEETEKENKEEEEGREEN